MNTRALPDGARHRRWLRAVALLVPLPVAALIWAIRGEASQSTTLLVMVLLVVGAAATGDRLAGALAALSSTVWFDFFFTEPYLSLAIRHRDDMELAVMLVVVGLAVTELALWGRRQQAASTLQAGYIDGVAAMSELALSAPTPDTLRRTLGRQIATVLGAETSQYVEGPSAGGWATVHPDGRVTSAGLPVDVGRTGLPVDAVTAIPVLRDGQPIAHFQVTSGSRIARPTTEQLKVAVLLAQLMDRDPGRRSA